MPPTSEDVERFVQEQLRTQVASSRPRDSFSLETLLHSINQRFYLTNDSQNVKSSCPFPIRMIPSLNSFAIKQARIVAKIQCAVSTRPIVTLAELEDEICFAEGVADFRQLGFGSSITSLDIIQQFFRVNQAFAPRRISSAQFMAYLISDDGARKLLAAGADSTDLVQGFTRFAGLRHANDCGIHIQNLPWLLALLRAEIGHTSQILEKRQQQAASLGSGIAGLARVIGASLWSKLQCSNVSTNDVEELVLHTDDPAIEVLPSRLRTRGSASGTTFIVCSEERANKLIQCAIESDEASNAVTLSEGTVSLSSPRISLPARARAPTLTIVETDLINIDDLEDEESTDLRTSLQSFEEAVELSFMNRVIFCTSDSEAESLLQCVEVLRDHSPTSSMSSEDFAALTNLACASGVRDIFKSIETLGVALERRKKLSIGRETSTFNRLLAAEFSEHKSRLNEVSNEEDSTKVSLCITDFNDVNHLLLPVIRGRTRLLLTIEQLTTSHSWPCTVLHGHQRHNLAQTMTMTQVASNRVQCVDTTVLFGTSPLPICRLSVIALQGLGIPCSLTFPSSDEHPFAMCVRDALEDAPQQLNDTMSKLFSFAAEHWATEDRGRPLCDSLSQLKWIPVTTGRTIHDRTIVLRSPKEVLDPSPKMMRLFEGIGAFAPPAGGGAPSAIFLNAIGAQLLPNASLVINALMALRPGTIIPKAQLERLYTFLGTCQREELHAHFRRNHAIIVIPNTDNVTTERDVIEVGCVVTCDECCWDRISVSDDEQQLFQRSLEMYYNTPLRDLFLNILSIERTSHLHCWVSSMRWNRTRLSRSQYEKCVPALRTLTIRCFEQHLLHSTAVRTRNRPSALLSTNEAVFPCAGGWRSAKDRIIFDGLSVSLTDTYRYSMGPPKPHPSINFFVFARKIDQPMKSLLTEMGLKDFAVSAETTLMFEQFDLLGSTELHTKLVESARHIQGLLKSQFPSYYQQVRKDVERLLIRVFVVVCQKPFILHTVRPSGVLSMEKGDQSFHVRKSVTTHFDRSNFVLYVADGHLAAHVLAEVFAELFCPLYFQDVHEAVIEMLQFLLRATDVERQSKLNGRPLPLDSVSFEVGEEWAVSAPFSERYRQHFPPGTDGLSNPAVRAKFSERIPTSEPVDAWATLEFTRHDVVLRQIQASGLRGNELMKLKRSREPDNQSDDSSASDEEKGRAMDGERGRKRLGRRSRKQTPMINEVSGGNPLFMPKEGRGYDVAAEHFAFQELRAAAAPGVTIKWVNATGEQGTPYDIVAMRTDGGVERVVQYYEVKSTCTKDRKDFEMSLRELLFAARYGKQYTIVRVFGASESNLSRMKMEEYPDPAGLWHRGGMTMTGDVKVVII
jgi:hypothetical protein